VEDLGFGGWEEDVLYQVVDNEMYGFDVLDSVRVGWTELCWFGLKCSGPCDLFWEIKKKKKRSKRGRVEEVCGDYSLSICTE